MVALACVQAFGADAPTNAAPAVKAAGTNVPAANGSKDEVVAEGRGLKITRGELDKETLRAKRQVTAQKGGILKQEEDEIPRQVLEELINVRLILTRATKSDVTQGKEKTAKRLADARAKAGSEQAFDQELKRMHVTTADLEAKWTAALTADSVLNRELNIKVTEKEVKDYYDGHPEQFYEPEKVRIETILIDTMNRKTRAPLSPDEQAEKSKQAQALLKRAQAGEDFAKLARQYSDDPVSKDKGGEYVFPRGGMIKEVDDAAFTMKTNEISAVITSRYGFHIIKLVEKIPSRKIPFSEAESDIRSGLAQDAIHQKFPAYIAELRKEDEVKILDPKLLPMTGIDPKIFLPPDKTVHP